MFTAFRFLIYTLSGVFFIPYLVRKFGAGTYGLIALAGFLTQYVGLVQRCVGNAVARFLNIALNKADWKQANEIFNTALVANGFFILLQAPLFALALLNLDTLFDFSPDLAQDFKILVLCNIIVFFISMINGVISTPVQASNRLDITTSLESAQITLRIVFLVMLIELIGPRLWIIGVVDLSLAILNNSALILVCRRLAPVLKLRMAYVTKKWIRPVLSMAGWSMVTALGGYVFIKTDVWMINRFVDAEIAGVYAALLVWPNFLRQVSKQLASVLVPVYMIDYARGDLKRVASLSLSSAKLLGCFVGCSVGGLWVLGVPLLELWLGSGASIYINLFRMMLIYLVFTIGEAVLWQIYTTINKVHYTGIVSIIAGAMNILISLSLIRMGYGAMGVAIGTALAQIFSSMFAIPIGVCREFNIPGRQLLWNYGSALFCLFTGWAATTAAMALFDDQLIFSILSFVVVLSGGAWVGFKVILTAEERNVLLRITDKIGLSRFRRRDG